MDPKVVFQVDKLKHLYRRFTKIPIPGRVTLPDSGLQRSTSDPARNLLRVNFNYRDPVQPKSVVFQKNFMFLGDKFVDIGLPEELSSEIFAQTTNKQGNVKVVLKSKSNGTNGGASGKSEQFIVVYDNNVPINIIAVQKLNEQMSIVENGVYATCQLSHDSKRLLCVVEIAKKTSPKEESPASKSYDFDTFEYKQSWGEQMETIYHSSLALINLEPESESYTLIEKPGFSLTEPFFYKPKTDKKNYAIGCVGWKETPYKLGLIYCTNRPGCLLSIEVSPTQTESLEPSVVYGNNNLLAISSPRALYSPSTSALKCHVLFLERDVGGAHNKPARLVKMCLHMGTTQIVLDNRQRRALNEDQTSYAEIGPLFTDNLPRFFLADDEKHLVLSSDTPLATRPFILNHETGHIRSLPFPLADCEIQQIRSNWIVALGSEPNRLPNIFVAQLTDNLDQLNWIPLEDPSSKIVSGLKFETFSFPSRDNPGMLVNCIYTEPENPSKCTGATLFLPHGGPHSVLPASYYKSIAMYNELGLKTCLINYVGSTGVDHAYVDALLGAVGTSDTHDCYDAIQYAILKKGADARKIILSGGSHGGFLVTSLSGQYPEANFLACIARNPVIDFPSLVATSDIPDWAVSESLGTTDLKPFEQICANNLQELEKMRRVSPLDHVHKVRVPTLMMLGTKDLRVPMSQGLLYHKLIKSRGVESRCFVYEDCHSLAKINVEFDSFVNIGQFIGEQLQKVQN